MIWFWFGFAISLLITIITNIIIFRKLDGTFFVNFSNPNKDTIRIQFDYSIEKIVKKKYVLLKVTKE